MREKIEKSRINAFVFQWLAAGGSTSRLAKAAGAEPSGQMRDEKFAQLWHECTRQATFRAGCCGPKNMSKSKLLQTDGIRQLFKVDI